MRFILSFTRDSIKSMIQFDNGIKIDAFLNAFKVRKKKGKANCDNSKWDGILALNRIGQVTRARDIMEVRIKEAQNRLIEVPTVISLVSDARYRPPRFHEYPPLENTMVTERWLVKSGPGEGRGGELSLNPRQTTSHRCRFPRNVHGGRHFEIITRVQVVRINRAER